MDAEHAVRFKAFAGFESAIYDELTAKMARMETSAVSKWCAYLDYSHSLERLEEGRNVAHLVVDCQTLRDAPASAPVCWWRSRCVGR